MNLLRNIVYRSTSNPNPFLSISLGNSPLKCERNFEVFVNNYIQDYQKPLTFVICDYIGYHNYLAFHNKTTNKSAKKNGIK